MAESINLDTSRLVYFFSLAILVIFNMVLMVGTTMAADADPLLDYCVGSPYGACKSPATVSGADFVKDFSTPGVPEFNPGGVAVEFGTVNEWPGVNTMGMSMARIVYAPGGLVNLHILPRATEIAYVVKGKIYIGFVGVADNKLYDAYLEQGQAFVIPRGLIRFSLNVGIGEAEVIATFNSENGGFQFIPQALFGVSNISNSVLAQGIGTTEYTVQSLKNQFRAKYGNI